jgi:hypothetical protein
MEVESMRREIVILAVMGALFVGAAVAVPGIAMAAEYKVTNKSGRTVGKVVPGPVPDQGDRIGIVRNRVKYRGAVYSRQSSSGYLGWPVSNTSSYIAWVKKVSNRRFVVKKVPWGTAVGRATKMTSGRWLLQKKSGGRWATIGRVQKGCRGQWAAGAARLLLWSR